MPGRDRIPAAVVRRVRAAAAERCGYCLAQQRYVQAPLEVDHILPLILGGTNGEENLWLACTICNGHKAGKVSGTDPATGAILPLFNPRLERWADHFAWSADGIRVIGLTPTGRATVVALHLDRDPLSLMVREMWVSVGWHPPADSTPGG